MNRPVPLIDHLGPWGSEAVPDTWCVVACEQGCQQTWTVDVTDFDPPLTSAQVEQMLTPDLLAHEQEHRLLRPPSHMELTGHYRADCPGAPACTALGHK